MRRYIKSYRTRNNIQDTSALKDQFLKQLTEEATSALSALSEQFMQDLQTQSSSLLQNILGGLSGNASSDSSSDSDMAAGDAGGGGFGTASSISQLLSTGVRYFISRPRKSTQTYETSRSMDANTSFKLSRAQSLAEAGVTLSKGDKNL